ncbi:aminotransferase class V-fold PLP-dependent enzyme [Actinomadura barringtoniae]|uniref:Aminotransferase class V-fold PLP-dependent enzyme n=1 Tax=Actinomadura barringtoniae TaxID=1427535 RepID=A0A939T2Y2_9ACTN|nr:pyridoxal-dependent decarboxylase [Actinomadura barringtoniae]MBO2445899.1 aminotransferase class V-fold PLP-dependent enzyme [Actinomadura barringtoniae]
MAEIATEALRNLHGPGPLDVGTEEGARLLAEAVELVTHHAAAVIDGPVAPDVPGTDQIREWLAGFDFDAPRPAGEVLPEVAAALRRWGVHPTHPRYLGLFVPTPTWWGVAGELIAAGVNPQLAAYNHAPAAVEMERHVLRFVAARLGLPTHTDGSFTVGGAEANLTAVVVALTRRFAEYSDRGLTGLAGQPVLYASAESHLAWLKIAHLTGLGRHAVRLVPVDAAGQLDLERLRALHDRDVSAGRVPFLLVATAGTTGGGAIDPLPELADLARSWGLHFHVDAAWGGAVVLSDRLRPLLAGVERADSVTIDAHKWLSAPMGAGMFLTRHPEGLADSFRVSTSYMPADSDVVQDPYLMSVQWSRRFAGLKVFLALAAAGREAYAKQMERDTELGVLLARRLAEDGWRRINDTLLPVVCVADAEAEELGRERCEQWHSAVVGYVIRSGNAWVSLVRLDGRPAIRLCVTSYRTRAKDIEAVVAALGEARAAIPR